MRHKNPIFLFAGLVALLAVLWGATYSLTVGEKQKAFKQVAERSERLTKLFESHATATFSYADDYIKTIREIYRKEGSLDAVRAFMANVPPSKEILSHVTMMNADGVPHFFRMGERNERSKPAPMPVTVVISAFRKSMTKTRPIYRPLEKDETQAS